MSSSETYKIRPAGRHILTIGRDLIQDSHAAVVELVKNAYDADSPNVKIEFRGKSDIGGYTIVISDQGHGMSRDTVINKWMVPSTRDKLDRQFSPSGRVMQGRKGVGRYAASILGEDLLLETITSTGEMTTLVVDWKTFDGAQYLDDVEILIETRKTSEPSGTRLSITGGPEFLKEWNQKQFDQLRFELRKLISPVSAVVGDEVDDDRFQISVEICNFPGVQDAIETIEPYPIFDLFDYRISGKICAEGKGVLTYSLQKARNAVEEEILFDLDEPTGCGDLVFDFRVYDRDKESIDSLIQRGLKDRDGKYVGKNQARQLLSFYNGVGVYRNGFRIRPYGDAGFDWIELDKKRVQNPSKKIGSNQIIGYVLIQNEELSSLIEKSARDGLKHNYAFERLKEITEKVILKLEEKRYVYRKKVGIGRSSLKVEREIERLFSFEALKRDVRLNLVKGGIDEETVKEVVEIISRDAQNKNKLADEIRQTVAIYQGQATLGKIINVILHEGRRPLSYFRNQIPNLRYWYGSFLETRDLDKLERFMPIAEGIGENAEVFVKLFGRLDPLAAGKRGSKKSSDLMKALRNSLAVFDEEMTRHQIDARIDGPDSFMFSFWSQDIYAIFTNLADNSIYWMTEKNSMRRQIIIDVVIEGGALVHVDYRDTGPGIEPDLIESEAIFDPEFSTKLSGTGLGLAIAGEAATRNGLELKAFESNHGAWFRLQPKKERG